jgi:putative acyl-CoA dehydrogenase
VPSPPDTFNLVPQPGDQDFFGTDNPLVEAIRRYGAQEHLGRLRDLGRLAGSPRTTRWAELVDRYPPRLVSHDPQGRRLDEVEYHPVWHRLVQAGIRAGLTAGPWDESAPPGAHTARAAGLIVWAQVEVGHTASLTTSYAAVPALHSEPEVAQLWLPRLASRAYESALRRPGDKLGCLAGLSVTESQGGSDLRTISTVASLAPGGPVETGESYRLSGNKWFISSPMSDAFLALAHAPGGPTCFLLPRVLEDGTRNDLRITRLKEKVGGRSAASAEFELDDTWAIRVGDEGKGLRVLQGTISASRLDSALSSVGMMRQALVQAIFHARHREAFGSLLIDKPLMQNVLADLALETEAATALTMRLAAAVDGGETQLLKVAVPVAKYWVTKRAVAVVAEAMECLGGNGYVEGHGMAKMYRDAPFTALWLGTGNINALDVLRAMSLQPRAMEVLLAEVDRGRGIDPRLDEAMDEVAGFLQAAAREARRDPAAVEGGARWMVERLAVVLQASLLLRHSPKPVSTAFLATRVAGGGGTLFGTLPVGRRTTGAIIERALPPGDSPS